MPVDEGPVGNRLDNDSVYHLTLRELIAELPPHLQKAAYRAVEKDAEKMEQAEKAFRLLLTVRAIEKKEQEIFLAIQQSSPPIFVALVEALSAKSRDVEVRRDVQEAIQSGAISPQEAREILELRDPEARIRRAKAVKHLAEEFSEALDAIDRLQNPRLSSSDKARLRADLTNGALNVPVKDRAAFIERKQREIETRNSLVNSAA